MDIQNDPNQNQEAGNPNIEQRNIALEINLGLAMLITLSHDLRNTREPSNLSLSSSLKTMISSIENAQVQLSNISNYRTRMR